MPTEDEKRRCGRHCGNRQRWGNDLTCCQGKLSSYAEYLGKPDYFQSDIDRYRKVTPVDVHRVAGKYLTGNRVVPSYVPGETIALSSSENAFLFSLNNL